MRYRGRMSSFGMHRVTTLLFGVGGGTAYNSLYFDSSVSGIEAADAQDAAASFWGGIGAYIRSGSTSVVQAEVQEINTETGEITSVTTLTDQSHTNTGTGDPLPPANQYRLRLNTNDFVEGRRLRGSIFIPGITENNSTNGAPTSSLTTDVVARAVLDFITTTDGLVVYSRPRPAGHPLGARAGVNGLVTGITGLSYFSVLRSRRD